LDTGEGSQLLVDGLQRVNTIVQYFDGSTELKLTKVPAYKDLAEDEKKAFLQYDVSVRDLGAVSRETIIEVFRRINATKYSLSDIEINNAVYAGALKKFGEQVAAWDFFQSHGIFNAADYKRMGDLRFVLNVICTLVEGYYNRDDALEEMLDRFNDDFPFQQETHDRLKHTTDFIEECGFGAKERVWRKADLFTLLVELDSLFESALKWPQPGEVVDNVQRFFGHIEDGSIGENTLAGIYYKAALQASNDRVNRYRRGIIMSGILKGDDEADIREELRALSLI
jgi:hypothetical protein